MGSVCKCSEGLDSKIGDMEMQSIEGRGIMEIHSEGSFFHVEFLQ